MTGEKWPDGMTVTVDEVDDELEALLYSRAAWRLTAGRDVPSSLTIAPAAEGSRPRDDPRLVEAWDQAWKTRLVHAGDFDDFDVEREGADAYFAAWKQAQNRLPAPWRDRFFTERDDLAFDEWSTEVQTAIDSRVRSSIETALVTAWRTGLTHISLIPIAAAFAHKVGPRRLLVSAGTWADDERLGGALRAWPSAVPGRIRG